MTGRAQAGQSGGCCTVWTLDPGAAARARRRADTAAVRLAVVHARTVGADAIRAPDIAFGVIAFGLAGERCAASGPAGSTPRAAARAHHTVGGDGGSADALCRDGLRGVGGRRRGRWRRARFRKALRYDLALGIATEEVHAAAIRIALYRRLREALERGLVERQARRVFDERDVAMLEAIGDRAPSLRDAIAERLATRVAGSDHARAGVAGCALSGIAAAHSHAITESARRA